MIDSFAARLKVAGRLDDEESVVLFSTLRAAVQPADRERDLVQESESAEEDCRECLARLLNRVSWRAKCGSGIWRRAALFVGEPNLFEGAPGEDTLAALTGIAGGLCFFSPSSFASFVDDGERLTTTSATVSESPQLLEELLFQ
jgi:hypothetical protein